MSDGLKAAEDVLHRLENLVFFTEELAGNLDEVRGTLREWRVDAEMELRELEGPRYSAWLERLARIPAGWTFYWDQCRYSRRAAVSDFGDCLAQPDVQPGGNFGCSLHRLGAPTVTTKKECWGAWNPDARILFLHPLFNGQGPGGDGYIPAGAELVLAVDGEDLWSSVYADEFDRAHDD